MNHADLERGHVVTFEYNGKTAEGTVLSAGPTRVHIQSGERGVYVDPSDVLHVNSSRKNEIPRLGERLRLGGGLE